MIIRWLILSQVVIGILLILGSFIAYQDNRILAAEVATLKTELADIENKYGIAFKNRSVFKRAVTETINELAKERQAADVQARYAPYSAAEDKLLDSGKWIYGSLEARFTLVEFSDLECPFCKAFHETAKKIVDSSKGNVNWQWKHLPLDFHNPAAYNLAQAAECVGIQKGNRGFWVFLDEVFDHTQGNGGGVDDVGNLAIGVGADIDALRECLSSGETLAKVDADIAQAKERNIHGTPGTFLVDNVTGRHHLIAGNQPAPVFLAAIERMLLEDNHQ